MRRAKALNPGEEFGEGIGLCQVVVAAGAQALHPLVHIAQGAENEDGRGDALGPQGADDGEAIELGQHAVDDENVVEVFQRQGEAILAIGGVVGHMAAFLQALDEPGGGVAVIFNYEYAHGVCVPACAPRFGYMGSGDLHD